MFTFGMPLAMTTFWQTRCFLCTENSVSFFCIVKKVFLVYREHCLFHLPRQQSIYSAQKTVFLSFALTTKCFLCIENSVSFSCIDNSVSFFCTDNKVFLVHREHYFFPLHWQQNVYSAQKTVFLSFAQTTKCFLYIENSVSFICIDKKVFLVHREQCFFLLHRQHNVSCAQKTVFLSFA